MQRRDVEILADDALVGRCAFPCAELVLDYLGDCRDIEIADDGQFALRGAVEIVMEGADVSQGGGLDRDDLLIYALRCQPVALRIFVEVLGDGFGCQRVRLVA